MPEGRIDRLGKNLTVVIPDEVASALGLSGGDAVELAVERGAIIVRPHPGRPASEAAADELLAEAEDHPLGDITFRELIDCGRRW